MMDGERQQEVARRVHSHATTDTTAARLQRYFNVSSFNVSSLSPHRLSRLVCRKSLRTNVCINL